MTVIPPASDPCARHAGPQSGILNRPPTHVVVAAFSFSEMDPAAVRASVEELRTLLHAELASDLPDQDASTVKDAPSPETGELGFADGYDRTHLTVTVGFASTFYDKVAIAPDQRPQDLVPIAWDKLGDTPVQVNQGDVLLQICADDLYIAQHVVHRVEHDLSGRLVLIWSQVGAQRFSSRQGRTNRSEGRALNGFVDGTANLDPRRCETDADLVFVDPAAVPSYPPLPVGNPPGYGGDPDTAFPNDLRDRPTAEPEWVRAGTYMVVRSSTFKTTEWDQATLGTQEDTVGRWKFSGAFKDLADDPQLLEAPPDFATNPANNAVAPDAHVRKANPRRADQDDAARRIFRRGYPLIAPSTEGMERGLLFIAFGRTISTQFEFVFRAWMRNINFPVPNAGPDKLFGFEKQVVAGGYYFVPPLAAHTQPWSWVVPASASTTPA